MKRFWYHVPDSMYDKSKAGYTYEKRSVREPGSCWIICWCEDSMGYTCWKDWSVGMVLHWHHVLYHCTKVVLSERPHV